MDISQLLPYKGLYSSLISFSSGHIFRISNWTESPTEYGAFSNLWMVTPEDQRILYADPEKTAEIVCIYHKFNKVHAGKISILQPDGKNITLTMQSDLGDKIEMSLQLTENIATRMVAALSRKMSTTFASKDSMIKLATKLGSKFVAKGMSLSAGNTETGEPFFNGPVEKYLIIKSGSAKLNDNNLGQVSRPNRQVTFGDFTTVPRSFLVHGVLYLPYNILHKMNRQHFTQHIRYG